MSGYLIENTVDNLAYLSDKGYEVTANGLIGNHDLIIISLDPDNKWLDAMDNFFGVKFDSIASECPLFKDEPKIVDISDRPSPYHIKNVIPKDRKYFDYYDYLDCVRATGIVLDPRIEHVQKKLFVNDRGHKSIIKDVKESIQTLQMYLEKLEGES